MMVGQCGTELASDVHGWEMAQDLGGSQWSGFPDSRSAQRGLATTAAFQTGRR